MKHALALALCAWALMGVTVTVGKGASSGGGGVPGIGMTPVQSPSTDVVLVGEILSNPTTTSMEVSFMPGATSDTYRVVYGTDNKMRESLAESGTTDEVLETFSITGLSAGTSYHYQVQSKDAQGRWHPRGQHKFKTMMAAGQPVHGCFIADVHFFPMWAGATCGDTEDVDYDERVGKSLEVANLLVERGCEWVVDLGDSFHTHCVTCTTECTRSNWTAEGTGAEEMGAETVGGGDWSDDDSHLRFVSAADAQIEADSRYEMVLDQFISQFAHSMPYFLVKGNHDGESPSWGNDGCTQNAGYFDSSGDGNACNGAGGVGDSGGGDFITDTLSETARLKFLTVPTDALDCEASAEGNCFAFSSGVLRFIGLDNYHYNSGGTGAASAPATAAEWVLDGAGSTQEDFLAAQLLNTGSFTEPFKFVGSHSLFGGIIQGGVTAPYYYARGNVRSTDTNLATGTMLGGQDTIQTLMKATATRGQVYISAHDHVTAIAKELESTTNPVTYVKVGHTKLVKQTSWLEGSVNVRQAYDQYDSPDLSETVTVTVGPAVADGEDTRTINRDDNSSWVAAGWEDNDTICFTDFADAPSNRCCWIEDFVNDNATADQILLRGIVDATTISTDLKGGCELEANLAAVSDAEVTASRPVPDYERDPVLTDNPGSFVPGFMEVFCDASQCHFDWIQVDLDDATVNNTRVFRYTVPVGG